MSLLIITIGLTPYIYSLKNILITRIYTVFQQIKISVGQVYSYILNLSLYSWGKLLVIIGILLPLILIALYGIDPDIKLFNILIFDILILDQTQNIQFFSSALILMVNLISFVFIVSIFLIQTTAQAYTPNLSKEIFRDKYLIWIFLWLMIVTIYNLSGNYFQLKGIYKFIGYIFSISSFIYLLSLSLITAHFLNISNTIKKAENRITSKISPSSIFKITNQPIKNEEFQEEIINDTMLITNTGLVAIENKDHELVVTCIDSLENIGVKYITSLRSPVDDDFIRDLNDQFEFLLQNSSEEYINQKYLGPMAESIGNLSRTTFQSTQNQTQTSMWLTSLQNVFEKTYSEMDRTEALGKSIREINRTIVLSLETTSNTQPYSSGIFENYLENITEYSLQNGAGFPFRICLNQYRWHPIVMFNSMLSERKYFHSHRIQQNLDKIADFYTNAMNSRYFSTELLEGTLFSPLDSFLTLFRYYGIYSLNPNIASGLATITTSPPDEMVLEPRQSLEDINPRQERLLNEYCEHLLSFINKIAEEYPNTNYHNVYSSYPELIFIFTNDIQLKHTDTSDLILKTTKDFFNILSKEITTSKNNRPDTSVIDDVFDFILIAIFYYRDDDEMLSEIFDIILDFYTKHRSKLGKSNVVWMYQYLKLSGCILDQYTDVVNTQDSIEEILIEDFYEPSSPGRAIQSRVERYGYPSSMSTRLKVLSTNQTWSGLQQTIRNEFYRNIEEDYVQYHEFIKSKNKSL